MIKGFRMSFNQFYLSIEGNEYCSSSMYWPDMGVKLAYIGSPVSGLK
jgi:hypothetical protein